MHTTSCPNPAVKAHNADIAAIFNEIADLLELQNGNIFRIRAYRNAARTFSALANDINELVASNFDLQNLPGIGNDLANKVTEIVLTGRCQLLDELLKKTPKSLEKLLKVRGLGGKRVQQLYKERGIDSLESLIAAASKGELRKLPRFGEKLENEILKSAQLLAKPERMRLFDARRQAESLLWALRSIEGVERAEIAGSLRRGKETVRDFDFVILKNKACDFVSRLKERVDVDRIVSSGTERLSVVLKSGRSVDIRFATHETFGAMWMYLTGSKDHTIALRKFVLYEGFKLNEYGVFRLGKRIAGRTEESIFKALGLQYIPSELRENIGEIEAAHNFELPELICENDLRGDLHLHTDKTDGRNSLLEMVLAAKKKNYEYIAITDHSPHLRIANGLSIERLEERMQMIDCLNKEVSGIRVLKAAEVDILEDGSLDYPPEILAKLDIVIGAIHSHFDLCRESQMRRLSSALKNPFLNILAHPTGRLINKRTAYDLDMRHLIKTAKENNVALELNSQPDRLDLSDMHCRSVKEAGVLLSIASDAHSVEELDYIKDGIIQAKRACLKASDVLNTKTLAHLMKILGKTRQ